MSMISIADLLVLLVEPSRTQQRLIQQQMEAVGIRNIDVLDDGASALQVVQHNPPDVVVSAMYLPDMTGAELVEALRTGEVSQDLPFLLISSETRPRMLEPLRQAGVIGILPKPFELSHLRDALLAAVDLLDPDSMRLEETAMQPEDLQVLIVDDSRTSRRYIRRVLENMGVERFTEAENGREGVAAMQDESFDLIVTDYNMPEMDGAAFVRYVREQSEQPAVPILMVTSVSDASRLAQVEQAGVSAIFDKPFEPRNILDLLNRVL